MTFPETIYGLGFCSPHTKAGTCFLRRWILSRGQSNCRDPVWKSRCLVKERGRNRDVGCRMLEWEEEQRREEASQIFGRRKISAVPEQALPTTEQVIGSNRSLLSECDQCERCWAERLPQEMTQIKGP
jgi:hypothetical protein